jgi:hypothetical protein
VVVVVVVVSSVESCDRQATELRIHGLAAQVAPPPNVYFSNILVNVHNWLIVRKLPQCTTLIAVVHVAKRVQSYVG